MSEPTDTAARIGAPDTRPDTLADYDGNKQPAEIERDIARTRANLGETLDALERRLAPRHLLEKGVDMLRGSMDGNVGRVGEVVRANPMPLALIGAGIGWLLLSSTGGTRAISDATRSARRSLGDAGQRASEMAGGIAGRASAAAGKVGEVAGGLAERAKSMVGAGESAAYETGESYAYGRPKIGESDSTGERLAGYGAEVRDRAYDAAHAVSSAGERVTEAGQAAWQRAGEYADYAGETVYRARDRFSQLMEDHPLAVGALGFLAGAVIAMSLPATEVEDEYLGETRDRVLDEAQGLGREAMDRAQKVAGSVVEAAAEATKEAVAEVANGGKAGGAAKPGESPKHEATKPM